MACAIIGQSPCARSHLRTCWTLFWFFRFIAHALWVENCGYKNIFLELKAGNSVFFAHQSLKIRSNGFEAFCEGLFGSSQSVRFAIVLPNTRDVWRREERTFSGPSVSLVRRERHWLPINMPISLESNSPTMLINQYTLYRLNEKERDRRIANTAQTAVEYANYRNSGNSPRTTDLSISLLPRSATTASLVHSYCSLRHTVLLGTDSTRFLRHYVLLYVRTTALLRVPRLYPTSFMTTRNLTNA